MHAGRERSKNFVVVVLSFSRKIFVVGGGGFRVTTRERIVKGFLDI